MHFPEVLQHKLAAASLFYVLYSINSGYYASLYRLSISKLSEAFPSGTLVRYTFNKSERIIELSRDSINVSDFKFDEDGVYNRNTLTERTVVFGFDGGKPSDEDSYAVFPWYGLKDAECPEMDYFAEDGEFKAIRVEGVSMGL